ncbi:MAG TPA: C45 family peptidase [Falsiroseomonas sp.]|nr:C45 family peptidase [Falsiroseomonas sp.]
MNALVVLRGNARERGLGQARACPEAAPAVRDAIRSRLAAARRDVPFLEAQRAITARLAPEALLEICGIATGFGFGDDEVFDFLHIGCLNDLAATPKDEDGCTAFARDGVVAKNRDFCPEHVGLQRIFLYDDPARGGRRVLCLGSLGAPGAWSSGMNSDGLALADTQIATSDHGPGMLRYFLMNALLARCATVAEALALIRSLPHAGGGSLVLADRGGAAAAVELRHRRVDIEQGACVAHTNHYTAAPKRLAAVAADAAGDPRAVLALHAPTAPSWM